MDREITINDHQENDGLVHAYVASERKRNGDIVHHENFEAIEASIEKAKYRKAHSDGYVKGHADGWQAAKKSQDKPTVTVPDGGYQDGFDKGVHRVLSLLGILDDEFASETERERLKNTVLFYRGLVNLKMDLNNLVFHEAGVACEGKVTTTREPYWPEWQNP